MEELGKILNGPNREPFVSNLRKLLLAYVPEQPSYKIASDFTMVFKPHSPTLDGRGFAYKPNNTIRGNQPIEIGYYVSCVNLGLYDSAHPQPWSLPLDNQRVEVNADKIALAVRQLKNLLEDEHLPFGKSEKVVNMADSGYAVADYVCPLMESFDNLLLAIRLRHGIKVYKPYQGQQSANGRKKEYADEPYYLQRQSSREVYNPQTKSRFEKAQRPIFELPCDQTDSYETKTARGRKSS